MNKRNGSPLEMGVTKRSSLESPPVSGRPLTRSLLRGSKSSSVLLNSPWTDEKRKRIRLDKMQKKIRPIRDEKNQREENSGDNKENQKENHSSKSLNPPESDQSDIKSDIQSDVNQSEAFIDSLNLNMWTETHSKTVTIIKEKLDKLNNVIQDNKTEDNFWTIEIERVNGEGNLFLSKKSKLNQFGEMCKDPTNQKFQVQKEDDLKAFWDGMVYPSVQDFINRSDWLIESGSVKWIETQKEKNPFKPVLKVQLPTNKPKPQKTKQQQEIDLKQKEKLKAAKEAADKRRAEMRKKMMEMKRKNMNS